MVALPTSSLPKRLLREIEVDLEQLVSVPDAPAVLTSNYREQMRVAAKRPISMFGVHQPPKLLTAPRDRQN